MRFSFSTRYPSTEEDIEDYDNAAWENINNRSTGWVVLVSYITS